MKFSIATMFLVSSTSALPWKDGKCKYQPGELKGKIAKVDYHEILGSWMQIWGEKNEVAKCKSRQFEQVGHDEIGIQYSWLMKDKKPHPDVGKMRTGDYQHHFDEYVKFYYQNDQSIGDYMKIHRGHF